MKARCSFVIGLLAVITATAGVLIAQTPQAVGTWAPVRDLAVPLSGGASVALPDGRTLIAAGRAAGDTPTDGVTIYDSVNDTLTPAGKLVVPRSAHTATLLKDGRVLIVGGVTDAGAISTDIERFDPATGTSEVVGQLAEPRRGHVAAALLDGTVLIAGGATTDGLVLQSAVIFNPETNNVLALPTGLEVARVNASATTLLDGRVLIAGGSNGSVDLASAEIFERYWQTFAMTATQMSVPRQGHAAVMLPHNGGVLFAGGTSNGAAAAGTDLFLPAVFPDPFSYGEGEFTTTGAMAAPRAAVVAGPTSVEGFAFVATAGAKDAEAYRFATIKTDKDDYAPGALAVITGSGWQSGEEVTLLFQEDPAVHEDYVLKVNADTAGNIYWDQWAPELHDLNVRFYLTAAGSQSRAQTTFTDGGTLTITFAGNGTGQVHGEGAGQPAFDCTNSCAGPTYTSNGSVTLTATPASDSTFVSWSSNVVCDPDPSKGCTVKMDRNQTVIVTFNKKTPTRQDQTITFATLGAKTYGDADFGVSATASSTLPVTFTSSGQCTVTGGMVHISGAGNCTITAQQAGNASYNPAPDVSRSFTIAAKAASVTANDKSKTYGQANPALDAVVVGAVNGDTLAYSLSTAATQTSGAGSYPIVVTLGDNPNYEVTPHDGTLTIGKATASVTASDKSKTYGQANPALDAVVVGAIDGDVIAYSLATAAGQTSGAGSYPIVVTLGDNPNYDVTPHDGTLTIGKATASVTANDKSKTYGQANPALDAVVVGAVNGDTLAYSLATAADQTTGVGSYPIVVTLDSNPNYDVAKTDGTLTIGKAPASVTANDKSKTYGQTNPELDAVVVGAVNGDTLAYSLATAADQTTGVGSYPIVVSLGSNPNYDVAKTDGTLTIGKAPASVTANDKSKTYGQTNPALDAVVVGAVNGDTLAYSLATAATQTSGVGSYPIVVTLGNNPNYAVATQDGSLTISPATLTITPEGGKTKILGATFTAFTGTVTGLQGTDAGTAAYASPGASAAAAIGSYDITATGFVFTNGSESNYYVKYETAAKGLVVLYRWDGFLQPVNDTAHDLTVMSKFKLGQTIPAKFVLKNAAGAVVQQTGSPEFARTGNLGACDSNSIPEDVPAVLADVLPQYKWDGSQYHYNWSTKGLTSGLYRIFATLGDGTTQSVNICLTK